MNAIIILTRICWFGNGRFGHISEPVAGQFVYIYMRRLMAICRLALILPVFLAFQLTAGPLALCGAGSKTIIPCRVVSETGERIYLAVLNAPEPVKCRKVTPRSRSSGGCCGQSAEPAPEPVAAKPAFAGSCGTVPAGSEDERPNCRNKTPCCTCLPLRTLDNSALNPPIREILQQIPPADGATRVLLAGQRQRTSQHAHSPPLQVIVRTGPQLCIEKCSFLL